MRLRITIPDQGQAVEYRELDSTYRFHRAGVVVVVLGALGGLAAVLWPFAPALLPLAAGGLVLALAAWLMVVSKVRYEGIDAFWSELEDELSSRDNEGN